MIVVWHYKMAMCIRMSKTVNDSPQYGKCKLSIQIVMGLGFLSMLRSKFTYKVKKTRYISVFGWFKCIYLN